ncbi:MAG: peptide deformylase [Chloroflexota bacterium]
MAIRELVYLGDERLRQRAIKILQVTPELTKLAADMLETMRYHDGVGLAGPQIGVMRRIFVAEIPEPEPDSDGTPHPYAGVSFVLINPEIVKQSRDLLEATEGCLSIPAWSGCVERAEWVEIKALNLEGQSFQMRAEGFLARVFLHELDHLNGALYVDHITDYQKLWNAEDEVRNGENPSHDP